MKDTIRVKHANVVLEVPADEKSDYINKGYSVIDISGNVIEEALSNDVNELHLQIKKLEAVIKAKDEEISNLKSEIPSRTTKRSASK